MEPVELPGSFPAWPKAQCDARSSMDSTGSSKHASVGRSIERPQSSPQNPSHAFRDAGPQPTLMTSRSATNVRSMTSQADQATHGRTIETVNPTPAGIARQASENVALPTSGTLHSKPSCEQPGASCADPTALEDAGSSESHSSVPPPSKTKLDKPAQQMDTRVLLDQISAMRRSHEAHISSMREAHDREVESHRSYITFLESCQTAAPVTQAPPKRGLTLDTCQVTDRTGELLSLDASASTSLQSLDSSLEAQRRSSVESAAAEAEALKRKLSLCRKTQSDIGDVKRERDHFRETNDKSERRIGQLKDIVRKSKDAEKAMKNKIQSLEAALLAANIQRIDVLAGYHEACEQISVLHGKQLVMIKEREEASARFMPTRIEGVQNDCSAAKLGALSEQVAELQEILVEKDARIQHLETQTKGTVSKLEMCKLEKQLSDTEAVRDQYNTLLHAELRRQSKVVAGNVHTGTPLVDDEAAVTVAERLKSKPGSENMEKRCDFLERELKHCVSEIILYKLDIRGYRKDLKEANSKITDLQTTKANRPGTPDSMEVHPVDDSTATPQRRPRATSGLGISLQRSRTPTRLPTKRLSTPQQHSRGMPTPSSNITTPLELDKQLPKPPTASRDPSPNLALSPPTTTLNRAETLRSLSESIISSYANRATPEQEHGHMPPLFRGRSADPPRTGGLRPDSYRAIDAIAVPISRYTPDMLKTPNMTTTKRLVRTGA